ncbi:MAG: DEAD/DEAH box helicase family protein [Alphaproteobacteria bacterium]|nr:DEAD/DEAH box helicase family protein [Alphaproteobacteria bacterium]
MEDWASFIGKVGRQYDERIAALKAKNIDTKAIEKTVNAAIKNFKSEKGQAFIIFGEPQSGKTEMMIALNAKLLDEGCDVIINLLTDSIDLLHQNRTRFRAAGLSPSPKQFSDLPSDPKSIAKKQWVLFSKKNARDLEKLIEALRFTKSVVVIDDEADYASPNSKINSKISPDERTKINELIYNLLHDRGKYIGVTATPARLDLNNTFENDTELWVDFAPHPEYVGQDFFFPRDGKVFYRLKQFAADEGNERIELRNAIFHFMFGVAEQHLRDNQENFTMLVHTSHKMDEHSEDIRVIHETIDALSSGNHSNFQTYVNQLCKIAEGYQREEPKLIVKFILQHIHQNQVVIINSKGKKANITDILSPTSLFSFGAGGNIISRGVTFDNLLSLYFTRSVKGKFTQDTYIQRARMFGARNKYKEYFQLWVPEELMQNWGKCFAFHQLAIQSIRSDNGAPVWLSDHKVTPTSPRSIDRTSVDFENGEMSWALFDFEPALHEFMMLEEDKTDLEKLKALGKIFDNAKFPEHVRRYIEQDASLRDGAVCFHKAGEFGVRSQSYEQSEIDNVRRKSKGIFSNNEFKRGNHPNARHHLKIFYNPKKKARLFYKINGHSIRFMQNRK